MQGTISIGPNVVSTDGSFPVSAVDIPLAFLPSPKTAPVNTGKVVRNLVGGGTGASYVTLRGVGSSDSVTKGTLLYLRTVTQGLVRMTTDDGSGGDVVAVLPIRGLLVLEFDPTRFLKLLEADFGGTIEYAVSGDN